MFTCPNCNVPNADDANFCRHCGKPLPPANDPDAGWTRVQAIVVLVLSIGLLFLCSLYALLAAPAAICAGVGLYRISKRQPDRARSIVSCATVCLCVTIGALAAIAAHFWL